MGAHFQWLRRWVYGPKKTQPPQYRRGTSAVSVLHPLRRPYLSRGGCWQFPPATSASNLGPESSLANQEGNLPALNLAIIFGLLILRRALGTREALRAIDFSENCWYLRSE